MAGWLWENSPPSQKTHPRAHTSEAHAEHTGRSGGERKATPPLDTIAEAWLAAVCPQSLPGVHSQPWTQEGGSVGGDS